jgi:hypothetical protein
MNTRTRRLTLGLAVLAIVLTACSVEKVDEAHVGVGYTDGPIEGKHWDGVLEPGSERTVVNDHVYMLPATQRSYIVSESETGDRATGDVLNVTARGGSQLKVELEVRFFLNTRERTLKPFFLEVCQKYDCWTDSGWDEMLDENFRIPMEAVANTVGLEFRPEDLRYDTATRRQFGHDFAAQFIAHQQDLIGHSDYFCGPGYDRDADHDDPDHGCPPISVSVTSVRYADAELEQIPNERQLAQEQEQLAAEQAAAARAQQQVRREQATPENLAIMDRENVRRCAESDGCTLIVGQDQVGVAIAPNG